MNPKSLHESPTVLTWFLNHMHSLGEGETVENHASQDPTDPIDSKVLDEDEAAGQETPASVTE